MKFANLLGAVTLTVTLGLALIVGLDYSGSRSSGATPFVLSVIFSALAGAAVLTRRHRNHIVPITAIYVVVMSAVLVYFSFFIAWYQGRVEF